MPIIVNQGMDYNVDIVMCIDATGSMHPILDEVKAKALSLYQRFVEEMENVSKSVQQLYLQMQSVHRSLSLWGIAHRSWNLLIWSILQRTF